VNVVTRVRRLAFVPGGQPTLWTNMPSTSDAPPEALAIAISLVISWMNRAFVGSVSDSSAVRALNPYETHRLLDSPATWIQAARPASQERGATHRSEEQTSAQRCARRHTYLSANAGSSGPAVLRCQNADTAAPSTRLSDPIADAALCVPRPAASPDV
jgi:hypothetical protein